MKRREFIKSAAAWSAGLALPRWAGGYYLNYFEPETGRKSDLVFGYQMDGQWITDHHGLAGALPRERVQATLETINRCNIAVTRHGAVNYANRDGPPRKFEATGPIPIFRRRR